LSILGIEFVVQALHPHFESPFLGWRLGDAGSASERASAIGSSLPLRDNHSPAANDRRDAL